MDSTDGGETSSDSGHPPPGNGDDGGQELPVSPSTDGGTDGGPPNPPKPQGEFTWSKMVVPSNSQGFNAVSGRGSGTTLELFVASSTRLLRFASGEWKTVLDGQAAGASLGGVWASSDGAVFVVGGGLFSCMNNCTQQSAFKRSTATIGAEHVCGHGKNVYAVGKTTNGVGYLLRFDFSLERWETLIPNLDAYAVERCWVQPSGELFIAAQSVILRYDGVTVGAEPVDYPASWSATDIAHQYWSDVTAVGDSLVAAGSRRRVLGRGPNGRWSLIFEPLGVDRFNTLTALGSNEALAAGQASPDNQRIARLSSTRDPAWKFVADSPPLNAASAWAMSPKEVYLVGGAAGGVEGVVYRGVR